MVDGRPEDRSKERSKNSRTSVPSSFSFSFFSDLIGGIGYRCGGFWKYLMFGVGRQPRNDTAMYD